MRIIKFGVSALLGGPLLLASSPLLAQSADDVASDVVVNNDLLAASGPDTVMEPDTAADSEMAPADEALEGAASPVTAVLPAYSPLRVMLNQDISTQEQKIGDEFTVTVLEDVVAEGTIVVPKGTIGTGVVTFTTKKGGFGKPGIVAISLRTLQLGDRQVSLDGRYREEGKNNNAATAATWFAVGVFAGFVKGKAGFIERGRELKAKTGEDITFVVGRDADPVDLAATERGAETEAAPEAAESDGAVSEAGVAETTPEAAPQTEPVEIETTLPTDGEQ